MSQPSPRPTLLTESKSPRCVAVIDIGATSIRMAIAEIHADGEVRTLDRVIQAVDLGREVFENRRIPRKSIERSAAVLNQYQRILKEYGVESHEDVRVVATTAVREASNRLAFADRIYVATGLNVEPIDEAEVSRITYMGVIPHLNAHPDLSDSKSLVIEVGGGNTELLVVRSGNVLHSQSFRLGSLRLLQTLDGVRANSPRRRSMLESHIRRTLDQVAEVVNDDAPIQMIALGGDMRFAARRLLDDWEGSGLAKLATKDLRVLTDKILSLDDDAIVKAYGASFVEAETLAPALLANVMLAEKFSVSNMFVCDTNLRDGLLHDMAVGGSWTSEFRNQIVRSAISLGRKFEFDETYARDVAELSGKLFDQLQDEHQLDPRHEVILFVAALLHEIGLIVNVRSNHKHSLYLIRNSELFGLSKDELMQVGLVARYHRRAYPQPSHDVYGSLPQEQRVVVSKLASILRLAIALNDTRSGRVREIECHRDGKHLAIHVPGVEDVSLEQIAMRENAGLFRDVFGLQILLRAAGG